MGAIVTTTHCLHCGRLLSPERRRFHARYCSPAEAKAAEKRRYRLRHRILTEAGINGFATRFACRSLCTRPDAAARLHVAEVVCTHYSGSRTYAKGYRYCRTCQCWMLCPERRFCPCCEAPLQWRPWRARRKWFAKHPELAPKEVA